MAYIYESDVGRLGGNLQTTVAYLLSLHKAEYEWNLLGIKVVGHVDALPIPDGTYDYGDAYTVGTAAPYDMWIYTRADAFHSEAYWFNIGKFPAPGPQGPKGDGLEQINKWTNGTVSNVTYDTTDGAKVIQKTTVDYTDSNDGSTKQQQFDTTTTLPIVPGKYISMDATSDNKKMEVKVDDTELALDYIKINKNTFNYVPWWYDGNIKELPASQGADGGTFAIRLPNGQLRMTECMSDALSTTSGNNKIDFYAIYNNTVGTEYSIDKTATDSGALTTTQLSQLYGTVQGNNRRIIYGGQAYIRMDPTNAPDGTLNYINIEYIEDGNGGYIATGKCFSITVPTRAWRVFDLDFGRSYTHNVIIEIGSTGEFVHFTLINNHPDSYAENAEGLRVSIGDAKINCTVTDGARYYAGIIYQDGDNFHYEYGDSNHVKDATSQVTVTDTIS